MKFLQKLKLELFVFLSFILLFILLILGFFIYSNILELKSFQATGEQIEAIEMLTEEISEISDSLEVTQCILLKQSEVEINGELAELEC